MPLSEINLPEVVVFGNSLTMACGVSASVVLFKEVAFTLDSEADPNLPRGKLVVEAVTLKVVDGSNSAFPENVLTF